MKFRMLIAAAAVATGLSSASAQAATSIEGTFNLFIANYDSGGVRDNSRATVANLNGNLDIAGTATYTGKLNFNVGSGNSGTTTIGDFFATGDGVVSGLGPLADAILSTPTWQQTTLIGFQAFSFDPISNGNIRHDDGVQFFDNFVLEADSNAPTTVINTAFDFSGGRFELLYAAANGNPSVLEVTGDVAPVPLPAGLPLLLAGLGGLGIAARRKCKSA